MAVQVTRVLVDGVGLVRGGRTIVERVSFAVERGGILALSGASGAGKSSVLRAVAGLDPIAAGRIEVDGCVLVPGPTPRGSDLRALHQRVGVVFQFHHLFTHQTALENVCLAPVHVLGLRRDEAEERARGLLAELGVAARASAYPHQLSGGEAQRVAIARALATEPPVLLMDEPTASLDTARRGELQRLLRRLADRGLTLIVASHDLDFARGLADRAVVLEGGRVTWAGPVAEVS